MDLDSYIQPVDYLEAKRKLLGEVFLVPERQFVIPLNQRPWAWRDSKDVQSFLSDFWNILFAFFDPDSSPKWEARKGIQRPPHFFGTFVFFRPPAHNNTLEIFDGQQRITAVTMLCRILRELAMEQSVKPGGHQTLALQLYGGFDSWLRVSPSSATPRLRPNILFQGLFNALILQSQNETERKAEIMKLPEIQRHHTISKKLISSFRHMRAWIRERTDSETPDDLTSFLSASHQVLRYLFSCIETLIFDEQYSYEVFGCLNARGERLTHADNIKNELFKIANAEHHRTISETWNRIGENVPGQDIGEFLRRRHIALFDTCKKQEIYSKINRTELSQISTVELISDWEQDSRTVRRILNRDASQAKGKTLERLKCIFDILNVGLAYIPLLSAARKFLPTDKDNFHKCVCLVENFVFRTLTIGQMDTSQLEQRLGEAARGLVDGWSVDKFREFLADHNNDSTFKSDFEKHSERRSGVQYYILSELEKFSLGSGKGVVPGDHESAKNHIEHILPKRLSQDKGRQGEWGWARANMNQHRNLTNRIGNLLILESDINKSVGNHVFSVKQTGEFKKKRSGEIKQIKCYRDSSLPWAKRLHNRQAWRQWTETQIQKRQVMMANDAVKVWNIQA